MEGVVRVCSGGDKYGGGGGVVRGVEGCGGGGAAL